MRNRAFRPTVAILTVLLLTGVPTQAAPITVGEVIQVLSNYQNPPDLRLRNVSQDPTVSSEVSVLLKTPVGRPSVDGSLNPADSLFVGIAIGSDPQTIDIIAQDDVEGTVCDCGEIIIPGGFPKWPLIFLAGIPLFFINGCEDCDDIPPTITPTPTPPTSTVPEPASLLLFGTGLTAFGIGVRRRFARAKLKAEIRATEERE